MTEKLEKKWEMLEDAVTWTVLGLTKKEILELADRLVAKAEWLNGLFQKENE